MLGCKQDDGSGELELDEFTRAVREECQLNRQAVPDNEIAELFGVIDADQSGAIDAEELGDLLKADCDPGAMTFGPFYSSIFELASVWVTKEHEPAYVRFLDGLFGAITEAINGHEMDLDTRQLEVLGAQPPSPLLPLLHTRCTPPPPPPRKRTTHTPLPALRSPLALDHR